MRSTLGQTSHGEWPRFRAAARLLGAAAVAGACWRDGPLATLSPTAARLPAGSYRARDGGGERHAVFHADGRTTFRYPVARGREVTARGRYTVVGDTLRAEYAVGGVHFMYLALRRGDSLYALTPSGARLPTPPLVRARARE